jgi:hypothetical protein
MHHASHLGDMLWLGVVLFFAGCLIRGLYDGLRK